MDVYYAYNYATAGWMLLQSVPLIMSPTMLVTLLSPEVRETTPLEDYFSRSLGLAIIALGMLTVLLTGSIPLTASFSDTTSGLEDPTAPYALPALVITAVYHTAVSFFCYTMWNETGNFGFGASTIVGAGLAGIGVWCVLFAASDGKISRKTGADKRTSGFPFKNAEADKKKAGKKAL
ncbi:hypothetical protein H072_915 [Dactylellina haptotyla CBS 200.50]|uniref:Uncharacterized protein n=1 Tax=Dactylellina haptotyla (strain CBS 200.50) TaxID=1284197 RepID=S8CBQ9_DACHA|nr:hypothetical protein H072_915 [Dactylellina haptotyla CBS 200.50]